MEDDIDSEPGIKETKTLKNIVEENNDISDDYDEPEDDYESD